MKSALILIAGTLICSVSFAQAMPTLQMYNSSLSCPTQETLDLIRMQMQQNEKIAESFPAIGEELKKSQQTYRNWTYEIPEVIVRAKADEQGNIIVHIGLMGSNALLNGTIRQKIGFKASEIVIQSGAGCVLKK